MGEVGAGPEIPANPPQASVKMPENPQGSGVATESSQGQTTVQERSLLVKVRDALKRLKPVAPEEDPKTGWGKGF